MTAETAASQSANTTGNADSVIALDLVDWAEVGDVVLAILVKIGENRKVFEQHARQRGISLEQLRAAAITSAVREHLMSRAT
jgi:hypothetical protein